VAFSDYLPIAQIACVLPVAAWLRPPRVYFVKCIGWNVRRNIHICRRPDSWVSSHISPLAPLGLEARLELQCRSITVRRSNGNTDLPLIRVDGCSDSILSQQSTIDTLCSNLPWSGGEDVYRWVLPKFNYQKLAHHFRQCKQHSDRERL
jgi:hypothetical protein